MGETQDPGREQSEEEYLEEHHPLRLPKGSVRALITLMSLGTLAWLVYAGHIVELKETRPDVIFSLVISVILMVAYYFAARRGGMTVAKKEETSPLFLPRGSIRFLLLAGIAGIIYLLRAKGQLFPEGARYGLLIVVLLGAFVAGQVWRSVLDFIGNRLSPEEPGTVRTMSGHVQAVVALAVVAAYCGLLATGWFEGDRSMSTIDVLDKIYLALIGFYFGNRHT